jgi:hypothetical protein
MPVLRHFKAFPDTGGGAWEDLRTAAEHHWHHASFHRPILSRQAFFPEAGPARRACSMLIRNKMAMGQFPIGHGNSYESHSHYHKCKIESRGHFHKQRIGILISPKAKRDWSLRIAKDQYSRRRHERTISSMDIDRCLGEQSACGEIAGPPTPGARFRMRKKERSPSGS